jgi:tripartite motif-containing protein 71
MPADGQIKQFGGAAVAIDFSPDPAQKYMFVVNQNNSQIEMIERETGKMLPSFGHAGRYAGELDQPHGIAVDSKGNVYIDENRGRRVHKFKMVQ